MRTLVFSALMVLALPAAGQNLLADGSFENGFVPGCSLGLVPDTWIKVLGTPDTFSGDCNLSPGAPLSFPPGHFVSLGGAADGLRFLALSNNSAQPDAIGQLLSTPLEAGRVYRMTVRVARSSIDTSADPLDVYLATSASFQNAVGVASLDGATSIGAWSTLTTVFCGPDDASSRPYLLIRPRVDATASYLATDVWELIALDEPCPYSVPGPSKTMLVVLAGMLLGLGLYLPRWLRAEAAVGASPRS